MKKKFILAVIVVFGGIMANNTPAVCVYNKEANAIWVYDYSGSVPCRPRQLLVADQMNDWGLVKYDATSDTYTVTANLWIGRNNGTDTFFQLGMPEHPNETLVVKGNLVIYPAIIRGENERTALRRVHRLTIGHPGQPDVRGRLLFLNEAGQAHTLLAGSYYRGQTMSPDVGESGQLRVYHGLISAADHQYPIGRHLYLYLESVVLSHATVSWVKGTIGFGLGRKADKIEDCIFEHSGNAFAWGQQAMRGVTFRNLGVAFTDNPKYPLAATLTECRFEDNDVNWSLCAGNIYMVDCEIKPPRKGNLYVSRKGATFGEYTKVSAEEVLESIRAISRRHVVFKVLDGQGKPVGNARVQARCEQDERVRCVAVTGADGLTPGRGADGALLLDEWEESAGPVTNAPVRRDFSYSIEVTPPKGAAVQKGVGFKPVKSWDSVDISL